jgi:hypothetical protein
MILFIVIALIGLVLWGACATYGGANNGDTVGPCRYDWDNKRYWREQTKEKRDRMNRRLEKIGDKRRV